MNAVEKEQFRAAIGPRAEYYLERFEKFERAGGRWVASWNWPAFFFSSAWFAFRRMGGRSLANFFLPIPFIFLLYLLIESGFPFLAIAGYLALAFIVIPMYANLFYFRHLKAQVARVAASPDAKGPLKAPIAEFYDAHKRLPAPQEASKFRVDGGKYTESVVYDAEKRTIVVTMGDSYKDPRFLGKRFAIHAEVKDGTIAWSCRTIDLDPKYLPAACRD